ncbi:GGDEF domain-containing protein [Azohydromonas lata]|uniref:GGDEF domain-containing protein n=2 Tax=Azohydromonas lata TaxID=45677 RepID=A0ABU5IRM5_9BURK|nr:GGDEF domain-containing protein [Azohydromonas lata]MDZ5461544.1 GGDEF domain-containing protein [Azohydromonas lata]
MLQRVASNTDICVRSGGDEFCVLLLDTKLAGAQEFEQWLLAALETKLDLPQPSIGMVQARPFEWPAPAALIAQADMAAGDLGTHIDAGRQDKPGLLQSLARHARQPGPTRV